MTAPIRFYFDFASPFAYFSVSEIESIGREFDRVVEWKPVLMWAILKAHGIFPPMESSVKREYLVRDMKRSAAFMNIPYRHPVKLPLSSHLAARLHHSLANEPARARALADRLFQAFFREQQDISDEGVLIRIASEVGLDEDRAIGGMRGVAAREMLEQAVAEAIDAGVVGSPFFLVEGEGFFGADRLPQLRWHLAEGQT